MKLSKLTIYLLTDPDHIRISIISSSVVCRPPTVQKTAFMYITYNNIILQIFTPLISILFANEIFAILLVNYEKRLH